MRGPAVTLGVASLISSATAWSGPTPTPMPMPAPLPSPGAVSLAGTWRLWTDVDQPSTAAGASAHAIRVPSNWYRQGIDRSGVVWLARSVDVPDDGAWRLEFAGVDYRCDVFWDGQQIGSHTGYFAPFHVAVPQGAGAHELAVRVDSPSEPTASWSLRKTLIKGVLAHHDTRPGGAWTPEGQDANTGGIWGEVRLAPARSAWIDDAAVTTTMASEEAAELRVTAIVSPVSGRDVVVDWRIVAPGGQVVRTGQWSGSGEMAVQVSVDHPALWWPRELGSPHLYRLELAAGADSVVQPFGIRTVREDVAGRYLINGAPIFLRGTNYIGSLYLSELDRKMVRRDLDLMIAAHINAIRVHAHVTSPAFYDLADELGLLVWQDFPMQWGYDDSAEFATGAAAQLTDMLRVLGVHPSVIHWTAQNEAPWSSDWMAWKYPDYDPNQNRRLSATLATVLATDITRPSQVNSGSAEHAWWGWYAGSYRDFNKPQTQAIFTEYGAQALPSRATLKTFLTDDQLWPLDRNIAVWEYHNFQRHELVDIAKVPIASTLDGLVRDTQAYQSRAIQHAAEGLRRQAWQPVTGIFQFMFVEHWPSMNWGVVDYLRQPKPGWYTLRRAYQPTLAMATPRKPGLMMLSIVNDLPTRISGVLITRRSRAGATVLQRRIPVTIQPGALTVVDEQISAPGDEETLTLAIVDDAGKPVSENIYVPGYFKD